MKNLTDKIFSRGVEALSDEELLSLYATLEKINNNFKKIGKNIKKS